MRKLKLQMQMSVDGYLAGPNFEMDWMIWDWDEELKKYVSEITEPVDTIILGKNLAEGFIDTWKERADEPGADLFAHKMNNTLKVVFSKSLEQNKWENTRIERGELKEAILKLKLQPGNDIIVYGGTSFVSSLIAEHLIDEFYLFMNPVILGDGKSIFRGKNKRINLALIKATQFECGIIGMHYTL